MKDICSRMQEMGMLLDKWLDQFVGRMTDQLKQEEKVIA
jgi:hypothetical protein